MAEHPLVEKVRREVIADKSCQGLFCDQNDGPCPCTNTAKAAIRAVLTWEHPTGAMTRDYKADAAALLREVEGE
jgi:hypothetical protein